MSSSSSQKENALNQALDEGNTDKLLTALQNSFYHHSWFSLYTSVDNLKSNIDAISNNKKEFKLYFGNPEYWNDKKDKEKYSDDNKIYFVRCLSYQKSESIAMWYMYGYPNNIRIKIPYEILKEGLLFDNKDEKKVIDCEIIFDKENSPYTHYKLKPSYIKRFDILYYSKNDENNSYFIQKGSTKCKKRLDGLKFKKLKNQFYVKRFAFASEVETRIQIVLDKKELYEKLKIDKKEKIKGINVLMKWNKAKSKIIYTKRPDFICDKQEKSILNSNENIANFLKEHPLFQVNESELENSEKEL